MEYYNFILFLGIQATDIYVRKSGKDTTFCGSYLHPCLTIKHVVMNISETGDKVLIYGRYQGKSSYYMEENIIVSKKLYFKGIHGDPVIYCQGCDWMFLIKETVVFEKVRFSEKSSGPAGRLKSRMIAFKVYDASIKLLNCYFDSIPHAVYMKSKGSRKIIILKSVFKNSVRAVDVVSSGSLDLKVESSKFTGPPNMFGYALVIDQDHFLGLKHFILRIQSCIFQFLQASIWLKVDPIQTAFLEIDESIFMNNAFSAKRHKTSMPDSSGVTQAQQSQPCGNSSFTIRNSKFINNTSLYGGALFTDCGKGVNLSITNCTFSHNFALMGGGAIRATEKCNLTINSSTFFNNSCNHNHETIDRYNINIYDLYGTGGALMLDDYEHSSFDPFQYHPEARISDCVFKSNWAEYSGGAIYTNSHILNITNTVIESEKSGRSHHFNSELIRCKYRCNVRNATFVTGSTVDGGIVAWFGESSVAIRLDQASKFVCPEGSILFHKNLKSFGKHAASESTERPFMMFAVSCLKCPLDHYSLGPSFLQNMTTNNQSCRQCPLGGLCYSGIIRPKNNFWGFKKHDGQDIAFVQLPDGYGCNKRQCRSFDSCAIGRTGTLCGTCENGMTESMLSPECISNKKCDIATFWGLAVLLLSCYLVFFVFKKEIFQLFKLQRFWSQSRNVNTENSCDTDYMRFEDDALESTAVGSILVDSSATVNSSCESTLDKVDYESNVSTGIIKILFYFYQIESLFRTFRYKINYDSAIIVRSIFSNFLKFDFFENRATSTCGIYNATPVDKILIRLAFVASLFSLLGVLFIITKYCTKKRAIEIGGSLERKGRLSLPNKIIVATFEIFLLNFALFASTIFRLLNCVQVNRDFFLYIQGNIRCYQEWQYALIALIIIWVLPFCAFIFMLPGLLMHRGIRRTGLLIGCVFPLAPLLTVLPYFNKQNDSVQCQDEYVRVRDDQIIDDQIIDDHAIAEIFKNRTGPFSTAFNERLYFSWEGVYILRRLIIVILFTFIKEPIHKLYAILMMQIIFLLHHVHMRPYASKALNHWETFSLTALVLINSMNLFSVYSYSHGIEEQGDKLVLLKAFSWIQLSIGIAIPALVIIGFAFIIIACLINLLGEAGQFLLRKLFRD